MDTGTAALDVLTVVLYALIGLVCGALISIVLSVAARLFVGRRPHLRFISKRLKLPQRVWLTTFGAGMGIAIATTKKVAGFSVGWRPEYVHWFLIVMIVATAFLLTGLLLALEDGVVSSVDDGDDAAKSAKVRRARTQMQVIRRVGTAVVWVCALGGVLFTFSSVRAIGASLFASAGVLSIVAGLAAQSTLSNLFAGLQLAFTDAIRVGDVVVVQGEWGHIEEITLTYVVVKTWDNRRLIMPSTYFTTTMFQNWTRLETQQLGTVEFDLDWFVPVGAMRVEFARILVHNPLWDAKTMAFQVTDAVGGVVRVRALMAAKDPTKLFDLRCEIREQLLVWLQTQAQYALPRTRLEPRTTTAPPPAAIEEFNEQAKQEWQEEQEQLEHPDMQETQVIDLSGLEDFVPGQGLRKLGAAITAEAKDLTGTERIRKRRRRRRGGDVTTPDTETPEPDPADAELTASQRQSAQLKGNPGETASAPPAVTHGADLDGVTGPVHVSDATTTHGSDTHGSDTHGSDTHGGDSDNR